MTDAFEAQGEFVPAQSDDFAAARGESPSTTTTETFEVFEALDAAEPAEEAKNPNGFVQLGLASELIAAVEDLGFTQPTAVQAQAIPVSYTHLTLPTIYSV